MAIITIDLHTHLNEKEVLAADYWKRVQEIKLNAVAITEHSYCDPKNAFEKLNSTKPENVLLIPGMELVTSVGHALVFAENESLYEEIELLEKGVDIERVFEIVKEKNFFLSFPHPYGYEHDSIAFLIGTNKTRKIIKKNGCGIEIYNGMISHLSNFLYDSNWITKPFNFLSFLEKNIVSRKIGLARVGGKIKDSFDSKRQDIVMRCIKAIELGNEAEFITTGSDAHYAERIGTGIMKIKIEKEITIKNIFNALRKKENIVWSGPLIKETTKGIFEKIEDPLKGKEIAEGLKYVTTNAIKKGSRIPKNKINGKIKNLKESRVTKKIRNIKIKEKLRDNPISKRIKNARISERIRERINKEGNK